MIKTLASYLADEVAPRWKAILAGSGLWISVFIGVVIGCFGEHLLVATRSVESLSTAMLTYASIAFGFCLAGLTLVLTLPDQSFTRALATTARQSKDTDSYSDLLFVFSWTALCHWILILSLLVVLFACDWQALIPIEAGRLHRAIVGGISALATYSLIQFLVVVITLSQVGRVYIRHLSQVSRDKVGPETKK